MVAGAVAMPQVSGVKLPGASSCADGSGNSSPKWGQSQGHDAITVEQHRVADGGGSFSSVIDPSSNPGCIVLFPLRFFSWAPVAH